MEEQRQILSGVGARVNTATTVHFILGRFAVCRWEHRCRSKYYCFRPVMFFVS